MKCPKCDVSLNRVRIKKRPEYGGQILSDAEVTENFELDQCLACNGIWFDGNELSEYLAEKLILLDSPKVNNASALNKKRGNCPKCGKIMDQDVLDRYPGAVIDICSVCPGIWLDSQEIDKLEERTISFLEKWKFFFQSLKDRIQERKKKGA